MMIMTEKKLRAVAVVMEEGMIGKKMIMVEEIKIKEEMMIMIDPHVAIVIVETREEAMARDVVQKMMAPVMKNDIEEVTEIALGHLQIAEAQEEGMTMMIQSMIDEGIKEEMITAMKDEAEKVNERNAVMSMMMMNMKEFAEIEDRKLISKRKENEILSRKKENHPGVLVGMKEEKSRVMKIPRHQKSGLQQVVVIMAWLVQEHAPRETQDHLLLCLQSNWIFLI